MALCDAGSTHRKHNNIKQANALVADSNNFYISQDSVSVAGINVVLSFVMAVD